MTIGTTRGLSNPEAPWLRLSDNPTKKRAALKSKSPYLTRMNQNQSSLLSSTSLDVRLENIGLVGLALTHLFFGLWVIVDPAPLAAYVDLKPVGPQAGSELRAMYGGLIIGFGAIQWRGYRSMAFRSAAIEATGWIFAGVALGRLTGLLDGALAGLQPVFLLGEVSLALACRFAVMHRAKQQNS